MIKLLPACCFCFALFFTPTISNAQTFGAWQVGSTTEDVGNDIATDTLGNMYVAGSFQNTANFDVFAGVTNRTSNGGSDIFLAKYSKYGLLQWVNTMGGSGDDEIKRVVLDPAGNIYVCGFFSDTVDFDPSAGVANGISNGGKDIFFAKYDNTGAFQWVKTIGTPNDDIAYGIALDAGANVCLAGSYGYGSADFDPGPGSDIHTNTSGSMAENIFFARYDNAGNYIWAKTLNGCCDDVFTIAADAANNVFIGGRFQGCLNWDPLGSGGGLVCAVGAGDPALAKYDPLGNFVWVKSFGSASNDEQVSDIKIGKSGNVFFTGYFGGNCNADPVNGLGLLTFAGGPGTRDIFIAKYDNNGSYIWAKGIGSTGNDWANAIGIDPGDNIYIGGAFQGLVDFNPGSGIDTMRATINNYNAFTATYDSSGAFVTSTSSYGGNSESKGGTVYASKGYTAGYFQGTENLGKYSFTSKGDSDVFFAVGCLQPIIASFSPASGPVGTIVKISGSNFDPVPEYNIVHFGSVQATVTAGTLFSLTVIVPAGALYSPISVENMCGLVGYSTQQFDLTFSCPDSITISSLVPSDTLTAASPGFPYNVEALDMDGDGKPDLLVTNNGNGSLGNISAYRNTGTPGIISFATPVTMTAGSSPRGICTADMDGDGKKDIIVANEISGTVVIYLNTSTPGTISFSSALSFACPAASSVTVADVDGDGRPDIICGNNGNNNFVRVIKNNSIIGVLSFANPVLVNAGGFPLGVCARDIDGDHVPDIITTNSNTNQISVIKNNSTFNSLSFSAPVLFTVGDLTKSANFDIGDLDGDGKADIAFGLYSDSSVGLLRNTSTPGLISFAPLVNLPVSGTPSGVRISDMNGDGQPDLIACYPNSSFVTAFQNKSAPGILMFKGVNLTLPGGSWNIAAEDLDGDGKNDLAVPYYNGSKIFTLRNVLNGGLLPTIGSNSPVCAGSTLNLASGGGATYSWIGPNEFGSLLQNPFLSNVTSAGNGRYSVTATNDSGCKASLSIDVIVNAKPTPVINASGATSFCQGGSVILDAGAYSSYSWSTGATTQTINAVASGIYSVTITDANGCQGVASKTVTVYSLPAPIIVPNGPTTFCQGGSVTLNAGSYISYSWSTGATTQTINVTSQNTYSVSVIDSNGCTGTGSKAINVNPVPTPVITANGPTAFCQGGSVTLDAGVYSSYNWSTGATTEKIVPSIIGINTYSVTVTSANGCSGSTSKTVTIYPRPIPVITTSGATSFCQGSTVTLDAGVYSLYKWSTGATTEKINDATVGLNTYSVTVTDVNSCTATASKTITIYTRPNPLITANGSTAFCQGGSVTLDAGSYSSYSWSTGATTEKIMPSLIGTNTYSVIVTDANGCTGTASKTVTIYPHPTPVISANGPTAFCQGGSVTLDAGSYSSYTWSTGARTEKITVSTIGVNTYSVTVTDLNGCAGSASITITIYSRPTPVITTNGTTTFCQGGSVTLDAGLYSFYHWNNGATTEKINPTTIGTNTYSVTVTDIDGCTGTASKNVTINPRPTPVITANGSTSFCQGGSVMLDAGSYSSYSWSTGATTEKISPVGIGLNTYSVTVTDVNGCTGMASKTVDIYPRPTPVITASGATSFCKGGSVSLNAGTYSSYNWSTGAKTQAISISTTGTYSVTVTDANGCTATATKAVIVNPLPSATASSNSPVCAGSILNLTSGGGTTYSWVGPNGFTSTSQNPSINNVAIIASGTYSVTVTNANGCSAIATTPVIINPAFVTCAVCNNNVVVVDQNVTINFNTNPPTYTGDPDLKPFFNYDISGNTRDQWNAIFNMGSNKLLVKNGATITTTSAGGYAPGIIIWGNCSLEVDSGGHIIVNSNNKNAGNILIQINGDININGEIRDEVSGNNGLPGCVTVATKCGIMNIGQSGLVEDIGVNQGGCGISLLSCGENVSTCNGSNASIGDITVSGLVKAYAVSGGDQYSSSPDIKVVSFNGAITINANTSEPLYDEFQDNGKYYDIYGGLLSWVSENAQPGKIEVQAKNDITVNGHGLDPTAPVRPTFGAIAAISTSDNSPGGLVDVRSIAGNINGNDLAFDVAGNTTGSCWNSYARVRLYAQLNISLMRLGANNGFNPVVNASSPNAGDRGGTNELRSFSGKIIIGANALVSAAVPIGSGTVQGVDLLTSCLGVTNNGTVNPADLITNDNAGVCSPSSPSMLYYTCEDVCGSFNYNGPTHDDGDNERRLMTYPNPTKGISSIKFNAANTVQYVITVFDITGRLVMNETIDALQGENITDLDLTKFDDGIYMLVIESNTNDAETREQQKIILE